MKYPMDWNDTSDPVVREEARQERLDYELAGCDTEETLRDDDQDEDEEAERVEFTGPWMICPMCEGEGTHVNPSIDSHGLTREDFDEDPDFAEGYRKGDYDVACVGCGGSGKIREDAWQARSKRLGEAAADRRLAAQEDGCWESGIEDWRHGG